MHVDESIGKVEGTSEIVRLGKGVCGNRGGVCWLWNGLLSTIHWQDGVARIRGRETVIQISRCDGWS